MSFRKEYPAIYMGNINRNLTQEQLEDVFEPLGFFQLLKHKDGDSKGWGFLCFANTPNANRARTYLLNAKLMIRGLTLDIGSVRAWGTINESLAHIMDRKLAASRPTTAPAEIKSRIAKLSYSVFVGNLPSQASKGEIYNMFSQCGDIITHFLALNGKRECMGYGFIDYYTEEAAITAVEMYDGYSWHGRILRVELADDVNQDVPFASPEPRRVNTTASTTIAAAAAATTTAANQVRWTSIIPQRKQASPAPTTASSDLPPPPPPPATVVPLIAPVTPAAATTVGTTTTTSTTASTTTARTRDLEATIRSLAPNLLQIALAVNAAEGLQFGLGVEDAAERLVKSSLLRTAVQGLVEKLQGRKVYYAL